jgi:hypothetical protein
MARAQDPTGVSERGMAAPGERGNWGEPSVSWSETRRGGPGDHKPWRGLGASPRPRALRGDHARRKHTRDRGTSDTRRTPRGSGGRRSGAYSRGTWGSEAQATHGRAGAVGPSMPVGTLPERDAALTHGVTTPLLARIDGELVLCLRNRLRAWRTCGSVGVAPSQHGGI